MGSPAMPCCSYTGTLKVRIVAQELARPQHILSAALFFLWSSSRPQSLTEGTPLQALKRAWQKAGALEIPREPVSGPASI